MDGVGLYLDLMKKILVNMIYQDPPQVAFWYRETVYDERRRVNGQDWPSVAHTMVGLNRLDNVQYCVEQVITDGIPGDFIETGVWRGGVCILMRAVLKAYGVVDRTVWAADSFSGIPDTGPDGIPSTAGSAFIGPTMSWPYRRTMSERTSDGTAYSMNR